MGKQLQKRPLSGRARKYSIVIPVSFETGEQAAQRVYFQERVRILRLRTITTKALAATDAGTVVAANATGNMTSGTLTYPLSTAINTEITAIVPTGANTVIEAGGYILLTAAKTTAGGKAIVTVEYEVA